MGIKVGDGLFIDMLLAKPLSAVERSKLFLCIIVDPSPRPLFGARCDIDWTLFGPLVTRLDVDTNREISPAYADRSAAGRDRNSLAKISYKT
jgi:hypothetical protein